jgi:hypothetical protein
MGISALLKKEKAQNLPETIDRFRYFTSDELCKILGITYSVYQHNLSLTEEVNKFDHISDGNRLLYEAKSVFEYLYPDATDQERRLIEAYTRIHLRDYPPRRRKRK